MEKRTTVPKSKGKLTPGGPKGTNTDIPESVRALSEQARRLARDQFLIVGRSIAENPALSTADKVNSLSDALARISDLIIEALASAQETSLKKDSLHATHGAAKLQAVSRQLIEDLSAIEGAPIEDLHRVIGAVVSAAHVRDQVTIRSIEPSIATLRPPVPELTPDQIQAIKARGKERPWAKRPKFHMGATGPFEWVRDTYREWVPGLRQSHIKLADGPLYIAFSKRISRAGGRRPDWLDVPSDNEHHLRITAFSNPVRTLMDKRRRHRERKRHARRLG